LSKTFENKIFCEKNNNIKQMPTGRQLYGQLKQSIRRQHRAGKTATQILNSSETKKLQKEYNEVASTDARGRSP
jgi:hypothetical protein